MTDITIKPQLMVECSTQRWSIETTFQACRKYLKLASTKGYGHHTVLRFILRLFGFDTMVVLLSPQLPSSSGTLRASFWRGTSKMTCSDRLTCVLRAQWEWYVLQTQAGPREFSKLSPSFQGTILYALAPAA
jgi:hypothetical protein